VLVLFGVTTNHLFSKYRLQEQIFKILASDKPAVKYRPPGNRSFDPACLAISVVQLTCRLHFLNINISALSHSSKYCLQSYW